MTTKNVSANRVPAKMKLSSLPLGQLDRSDGALRLTGRGLAHPRHPYSAAGGYVGAKARAQDTDLRGTALARGRALSHQIGVHPIWQSENIAQANKDRLGRTTAMLMNAAVILPPSAQQFQMKGSCE